MLSPQKSEKRYLIMAIAGIVNVALNGYEAKVTTKEEAKQMILTEVGKMVEQFAGEMPVEQLDKYCAKFGIAFEAHDGRIGKVVFN